VTRPDELGGLGFSMDVGKYGLDETTHDFNSRDPVHRKLPPPRDDVSMLYCLQGRELRCCHFSHASRARGKGTILGTACQAMDHVEGRQA